MKEVTITKTVPVNNIETLRAWLSGQLRDYLDKPEIAGLEARKATAGSKAIDLILEAGFVLQPPVTPRNRDDDKAEFGR